MARHFRGAVSMTELDNLPLYELQTLYYIFWKEKEAESNMTDDEKSAKAIADVMQDHL